MQRSLLHLCLLVVFSLYFCAEAQAGRYNIGTIVILGDDLLMGEGLDNPEDHVTRQLEEAVNKQFAERLEVKLVAQEGGTTISSLALIPQVIAEKPRIVIVAIGYNDALSKTDPDIVYNNLDTLLRELDRIGAYVMLVGVEAPVWMDHKYAAAFNAIYPKISQRYRVVYHNGFLKDVQGEPEMTLENRYHPNRFGIAKIVENILPGMKPMLRVLAKIAYCEHNKKVPWCREYLGK